VLAVPSSTNSAKLRKIVLALDGSLLSEMVMPIVKDMSRVHGSAFLLTRILGRSEIRHRNYSAVDKHLVDLASNLEGSGVDCKIVTGSGNTEAGIVRAAVEEQADMILMASHGPRGFKRSIFGTMASKVIRRSSVPVLVAKAHALAAFAESQALPAVEPARVAL
jgi:nucleotide-binding universal stress UspA family protein